MRLRPLVFLRDRLGQLRSEAVTIQPAPAEEPGENARATDDIDALLTQVQLAYEQQSRLIRGIGHDFKSPLASILRLSEALADGEFGPMDNEQTETAQVIAASAHHLMAIAQALYAVGGAREGDSMSGRAEVDLATTVARVVDAHVSAARARSIELRMVLPDSAVIVCAAQGTVERVLGNVINNAVKYTFEGSVTVTCTRVDDMAEVVVEDTGIGIPEGEISLIGTEFVRGSNTEEISGSGVGLAVARHLLVGMGGTLSVTSSVGIGSRFVVRLPATPPVPASCA